MKKIFIFTIVCAILLLQCVPATAATIDKIATEEYECQYSWSGTWQGSGANDGNNCFDADYNNKWGSDDIYLRSEAEWVAVQFPQEITISGWCIFQSNEGYSNIAQYSIQVQQGTEEWVTIYTSEEFTEFWFDDDITLDKPVQATAWRFYVARDGALPGTHTAAPGCAVELTEIEIYTPVEVADPTQAPATEAPATEAPATDALTTEVPATKAPTTNVTDADDDKGGCGGSSAIAQVILVLGIALLIKKGK